MLATLASALVIVQPVAEAPEHEPLTLTAKVIEGYSLKSLTAHWRRPGEDYRALAFGKAGGGEWAATIDAPEVRGAVLDVWVSCEAQGAAEESCFASADKPHPILVRGTSDAIKRNDRLARYQGNTSRASARLDWVSYGSHGGYLAQGAFVPHSDGYYQLEADYLYRLLGVVDSIRLGAVRLRGSVPPPSAFDPGSGTTSEATRSTGVDYGFGELSMNLSDYVGLTGKVILGADELGFATGFGGSLRIGATTGAHAELGAQVIQRAGFDAFFTVHWDTVPRWPIALGVHVTDMPKAPVVPGATPEQPVTDGGAPVGVRAVLDIGYEATKNVTLLVRAGYQARFSTDGGPTIGGGLAVSF